MSSFSGEERSEFSQIDTFEGAFDVDRSAVVQWQYLLLLMYVIATDLEVRLYGYYLYVCAIATHSRKE